MNKYTPVGIDLAKNVFQIHYVDESTGEIVNKAIKRANLLNYFINKKKLSHWYGGLWWFATLGKAINANGASS